ncbi:MAG: alpha/beta fold hydrolase [Deltaproteobacteria bacterium]|nr:alpha/beta fold hydrolase [Deltaproteobacteria bacterium]
MEIRHLFLEANGVVIPSVQLNCESRYLAIVIHGYGGNKEEMMGLSSHLLFRGYDSLTIDLRGHGESLDPYSIEVLNDVNYLIDQVRQRKTVIAIGHSVGGRLALLSNADVKVGISPALKGRYSEQTRKMIQSLRSYRVIEESADTNFEILEKLSSVYSGRKLVVYGSRDVPEIKQACKQLEGSDTEVQQIVGALHNDICVHSSTFQCIDQFIESLPNGV